MSGLGAAAAQAAISGAMNYIFSTAGYATNSAIDQGFWEKRLGMGMEADKELFDYKFNAQNEYNSPSAQMQRLMSAGLNPNLVYGSAAPGGTSGNVNSSSPSVSAGSSVPTYSTIDVARIIAENAATKKADSEANLNNAQANYINSQNERYNERVDAEIAVQNKQIEKLQSEMDLNEADITLKIALTAQAEADAAYKYSEISKNEYIKRSLAAQTLCYQEQAKYYKASAAAAKAQGKLYTEQAGYYAQAANVAYTQEALNRIEIAYNEIVSSPRTAEAKNAIILQTIEVEAKRLGIKGNKAVLWTDQVMQWLTGGAGAAQQGTQAILNSHMSSRPAAAAVVK